VIVILKKKLNIHSLEASFHSPFYIVIPGSIETKVLTKILGLTAKRAASLTRRANNTTPWTNFSRKSVTLNNSLNRPTQI
jgi:hypothetical protein